MKRRLLEIVLVLAIAALAGWTAGCKSELPDDAVAKIGETYITADQFDAQVAREAAAIGITKEAYPDLYEKMYKGLEQSALENLVVGEVVLQEAPNLGLSVTDAEFQTEFDGYLSYYDDKGGQAAFEAELQQAGYTLDEFKTLMRKGLTVNKVRDEVIKDVTSVPEEEIAAYYQANLQTFYVQPSREVRHILIKPVPTGAAAATPSTDGSGTTAATAQLTEADWAKALATAKDVRRRLVNGGSWTDLAREYSGDFQTKDAGGEMGVLKLGANIKEFEDAAFALELDEISQPVRTVYGYEIIQATVVIKGGQRTLDETRAEIEAQLLDKAKNAAWESWLQQKKAAAKVIYRSDLQPAATTTTVAPTTTTARPLPLPRRPPPQPSPDRKAGARGLHQHKESGDREQKIDSHPADGRHGHRGYAYDRLRIPR